MNNRIDAIYARQSVDKKDSISCTWKANAKKNNAEVLR